MKNRNLLEKIILPILVCVVLLACNLTAASQSTENSALTQAPTATVNDPATEVPAAPPPAAGETEVTFGSLTLMVPPGVASGASGTEVPRADSADAAYWQKTPGHTQVMLGDYYVLQGKFHQPQILVYPAQAYAEMVPPAFESIRRLNNILYGSTTQIDTAALPAIPFLNAQAVYSANIQAVSFQNGGGVRFLTQYAQYPAPANNHELFYHFQGVTRDGAYYIIAIFPVTAPGLPENSNFAADFAPGGVAYPDMNNSNADWDGYYTAVTQLLNTSPADFFTPQLGQLDALIQSMVIAP